MIKLPEPDDTYCGVNYYTKDQAIAYSQFLSDVTTAAGLLAHGKQSKALAKRIADYAFAVRSEKHPAPAPDCRTCDYRETDADKKDVCYAGCVNGDQYQPAPAVVLWRTT